MLDNEDIFRKVGNEKVNADLKDEILVRNSSSFALRFLKPITLM
jgi:hypothetical protein